MNIAENGAKQIVKAGSRLFKIVPLLVLANLVMTITLLSTTLVYWNKGGDRYLFINVLAVMGVLNFIAAVTSAFFYMVLLKKQRILQILEIYMRDFAEAPSAEAVLQSISAFPVGGKADDVVRGWNNLLSAIDQIKNESQIILAGKDIGNNVCGYDAQRLLGVLDSLADGIILADAAGTIIFANRASEGMIGRPLSEFMYRSLLELFNDDLAKESLKDILGHKSLKASIHFETMRQSCQDSPLSKESDTPSKTRPLKSTYTTQSTIPTEPTQLSIAGFRLAGSKDNSDIILCIRDITQQRVKEASRDDFIAHVSHELRSPLTNIRAYAETLLSDMVLDASTQKEAFNVINSETLRLIRLVNEVLDISRMETGALVLNKSEVITDRLVQQCVNDIKASANSRQIAVQTNYHPKLPNLNADREKLAVVINNVLTNAIKYTPEGGAIFIETNVDERFVYIKIADTGYGIAQEDIDKIFDKFYRVSRPETHNIVGTGLGLSTSKLIMNLHGGTINVASEINRGSEFTIKLPITTVGPVLGVAAKSDKQIS